MQRKQSLVASGLGMAAILALSDCAGGTGGGSDTPSNIGKPDGAGKAVTGWVMESDLAQYRSVSQIHPRSTLENSRR